MNVTPRGRGSKALYTDACPASDDRARHGDNGGVGAAYPEPGLVIDKRLHVLGQGGVNE